jgi:ADP-ribosylglycohydrolase
MKKTILILTLITAIALCGCGKTSASEIDNIKTKEFDLFNKRCTVTDDSVMSVAVAEMCIKGYVPNNKEMIIKTFKKWGQLYPNAGYGGMFYFWIFSRDTNLHKPYNSYGNGSGMRVSPVGFYARSLKEALKLAEESAEVTHNHPEGIKGAQAIASAIYLARMGKSKQEIKEYIEDEFDYDLSRTCDEIRPDYCFNETCQGCCPEAIIAFLESDDYESAVRLAVSLGGDSDTIACMTGSIAAAFYGVPDELVAKFLPYLSDEMRTVLDNFEKMLADRQKRSFGVIME